MMNPDFKNIIKEAKDEERDRVLTELKLEINRVSLTGFTKYTYRKWILEIIRKRGGER